jgi:hypothetical protein
MFTDEWQGRYVRYYCEEVAVSIRGPNRTCLWEHIIPQSGEAEPFIAHLIVALSKSQSTHWARNPSQYGKALEGMRLAIQNKIQDRRKALIACLLVICFECLLGLQAAASSYAPSGVSLLYNCHENASSFVEDDVYSAFSGLDLQLLILVNTQFLATHQIQKTIST